MSYLPFNYTLLGVLKTANLNSTSDQAIAIQGSAKYIIDKVIVTNVSTSLAASLAAGGFYTGASKTGTIIIAAGQLYTALTAVSKFTALTLALTTDSLTTQTVFFSLTTPHGSPATCDIYIYGYVL